MSSLDSLVMVDGGRRREEKKREDEISRVLREGEGEVNFTPNV